MATDHSVRVEPGSLTFFQSYGNAITPDGSAVYIAGYYYNAPATFTNLYKVNTSTSAVTVIDLVPLLTPYVGGGRAVQCLACRPPVTTAAPPHGSDAFSWTEVAGLTVSVQASDGIGVTDGVSVPPGPQSLNAVDAFHFSESASVNTGSRWSRACPTPATFTRDCPVVD
jgi:hypothetical protein